MTNEQFIKFHAKCKEAFGNIFRSGARVEVFPHNMYSWRCIAIDPQGNVMQFGGEHGSSNPESVIGVLDGKVIATEHSNGRFQQACRTVSAAENYETIVKVAYGKHELASVDSITDDIADRAFNMLKEKAEAQKAANEAEDEKKRVLIGVIHKFTASKNFKKAVMDIHEQWFGWCLSVKHNANNKSNDKVFSSQSVTSREWYCNASNLTLHCGRSYLFGAARGAVTSLSANHGTEVSKETFYKHLIPYLKGIEKIVEKGDFSGTPYTYMDEKQFLREVLCKSGNFTLVWDDGAVHYFVKNFVQGGSFPKGYKFKGAAWRDGLRKATEDEEKTITEWVKVCGDCKLDTAMVNWSKMVWRDPTEAELNELP